jgi:large subunit ribosomal protein L10
MENPRPEKVAVVDEVRDKLTGSDAALLTEYRGLTVKQLADLRRQLRPTGAEYKVYKNTLVRFAAREVVDDQLDPLLTGPTAITFVHGDVAAVAKTLRDFARTNQALILKGGLLGPRLVSAKDVEALADLPSRDVLLAQLAGALQAPLTKLAGLLQALPRNFAYGLSALIDQRGGAPEPADDTAADEAASDTEAAPAEEAADRTPAEAAASDTAAEEAASDTAAEEAASDTAADAQPEPNETQTEEQ